MNPEHDERRVTAGDFLRLGVALATLRLLLNMPNATFTRGDCPNCGPNVLMLQERGRNGAPAVVTCTNCPYKTSRVL